MQFNEDNKSMACGIRNTNIHTERSHSGNNEMKPFRARLENVVWVGMAFVLFIFAEFLLLSIADGFSIARQPMCSYCKYVIAH